MLNTSPTIPRIPATNPTDSFATREMFKKSIQMTIDVSESALLVAGLRSVKTLEQTGSSMPIEAEILMGGGISSPTQPEQKLQRGMAMTITSIAPTATVTSAASSASQSAAAMPTVDYTEFLQLLVAELQNQDPTSPTDPTQYMSQLASFSSVEQQVQTNSTLDSLLSAQARRLSKLYALMKSTR